MAHDTFTERVIQVDGAPVYVLHMGNRMTIQAGTEYDPFERADDYYDCGLFAALAQWKRDNSKGRVAHLVLSIGADSPLERLSEGAIKAHHASIQNAISDIPSDDMNGLTVKSNWTPRVVTSISDVMEKYDGHASITTVLTDERGRLLRPASFG